MIDQTAMAISMVDLFISLVLATLIALGVVWLYRYTHRELNYERSFLTTLVMSPSIIALVMLLIGSNLTLSLGMVGALSIIRFRTVIKDSRDMVYLFFVIAIGLGCGTYNWLVTFSASVFISLVLLALHLVQYGKRRHAEYVLVLSGNGDYSLESLKAILENYAKNYSIRSIDLKNSHWEIVFEIRFSEKSIFKEKQFIEEFNNSFKIENISLLAPQLSLPL